MNLNNEKIRLLTQRYEIIDLAPLIGPLSDIHASSIKKGMEICQHEEESCQKMKKKNANVLYEWSFREASNSQIRYERCTLELQTT